MTTLARDAATADVAATLVANAVDVDSPAVRRRPARELDPDSDLRDLPRHGIRGAADARRDRRRARRRRCDAPPDIAERGLITDAALMLAGEARTLGETLTIAPGAARIPSPHASVGRGLG